MKIYRLESNDNNKLQHELFLKQYNEYLDLEDKSDDIKFWLSANEYRLNVNWLDIEDAIIIEEVKPVKKKVVKRKK